MAIRIGFYICHCGINIAYRVRVEEVAAFARQLPNVVVARDYKFMCSDPGQEMIENDIKMQGVNRVVVVGHTLHFGFDARYMIELARTRRGEVAIQAYLDHTDPNVASRMAELKAQGVKAFRVRLLDPWQSPFPASHPILKAYEFAA